MKRTFTLSPLPNERNRRSVAGSSYLHQEAGEVVIEKCYIYGSMRKKEIPIRDLLLKLQKSLSSLLINSVMAKRKKQLLS